MMNEHLEMFCNEKDNTYRKGNQARFINCLHYAKHVCSFKKFLVTRWFMVDIL